MRLDHNIFATSFILDTLDCVETTAAKDIKYKCVKTLMQKAKPDGVYVYKQGYPGDLDDTTCALAALYTYDKELISGTIIGKYIKALILCEENEGGPYNTWITKDAKWKDIDLAVNINIAYFLKLLGVTTPALERLINLAIKNDKFTSKYYASETIVIYFLSRFYEGTYKNGLISNIMRRLTQSATGKLNYFDKLLLVNTLLNLNHYNKEMDHYIRQLRQSYDQQCQTNFPFIIEKTSSKNIKYYGNANVTQALKVRMEILTRKNSIITSPDLFGQNNANSINTKIINAVLKDYKRLTKNFNYTNILNHDLVQDVILQPFHFAESVSATTLRNKFRFETLIKLGLANICGWTTYTIYDHLIDKDNTSKEATDLCTANICFIKLTEIYTNHLKDPFIISKYFRASYTMTKALKNARPSTNQLYRNSFGYALAPIYIWCKYTDHKDKHLVNLINFYKYYLNARQIMDDIRDWKEDHESHKLNKSKQVTIYDFWEVKAHELIKEAYINVNKAKDQLKYLGHNSYLSKTLNALEINLQTTTNTINKTNDFLSVLKFNSP